ncbi:MAG: hypothetical protein NTY86_16205, partial [Deltaproteobacteria bacterium]|nr:hypothetical protein [Deltaproteobacteria bacterium]
TSITPDPLCIICHNDVLAVNEFTPWVGTKHSGIFRVGINGGPGTGGSDCLPCHTVGYDLGANKNGGFDDLAAAQTPPWVLPDVLKSGNWGSLLTNFPAVARLANIQCENCHGPNIGGAHKSTGPINNRNPFTSARISYSSEVCGPCHGDTDNHEYSDWSIPNPVNNLGHSNRSRAIASGTSTSCGRCHSAQGYTIYVDQLSIGRIGNIDNVTLHPAFNSVTAANVEPVTCTACHDPHDATNTNQLRVFNNTPLLPAGFMVTGFGKGAICVSCHNSRNGAQTGSTILTYLHEDGETYNSGNPTGYSAPHQAAQGDVFAGRNAYFLGSSTPNLSKHAAVADTCVGCHMTLQPKTFLSAEGTPTTNSHLFRILDEDLATVCANCHSSNVDGAGIQASVEARILNLKSKIEAAALHQFNGVATISVTGATDPATDTTIGSGSGSFAGTLITSVTLEELHGQIAFIINMSSPVTFGTSSTSQFAVQLGNIKSGGVAVYLLSGNMVRAGWNYFLIEGDASKGIHNPSFVQAVLNASMAKDLSN